MNKTYEFLSNLIDTQTAEFVPSVKYFLQNIKRFKYMLEYAFPKTSVKFGDFMNTIPENVLDASCDETFLARLYANGEVFENGKVAVVEALEDGEDEIKLTFVFNKIGNLTRIDISSEVMSVSLLNENKNSDLIIFEILSGKTACFKLVETLKGCCSLNRADNINSDFVNVCSFEPDRLDRKASETSDMIAHWKKVAERDNVLI